jgi:hypothetical protein
MAAVCFNRKIARAWDLAPRFRPAEKWILSALSWLACQPPACPKASWSVARWWVLLGLHASGSGSSLQTTSHALSDPFSASSSITPVSHLLHICISTRFCITFVLFPCLGVHSFLHCAAVHLLGLDLAPTGQNDQVTLASSTSHQISRAF